MTDKRRRGVQRATLQDRYGLCFYRAPFNQIVDFALTLPHEAQLFCTCNLNHLRLLQIDAGFREAYRKASVVTIDSRPIRALAQFQVGEVLPLVTGADLFAAIIKRLRPDVDRPFFIASSEVAGNNLVAQLTMRGFAPESVGFDSPPFGFQNDETYSSRLIEKINAMKTTHLFMGVGAPKSERWIAQNLTRLPPANVFCVGAALDFSSGLKHRAPTWVRRLSMEWLHRLLSEPKRLIPRYFGDAVFLVEILAGRRLVQVCAPNIAGSNQGTADSAEIP
ncbi:N/A [soil metagenome]